MFPLAERDRNIDTLTAPNVDIRRLTYDINSTFNPLHAENGLEYSVVAAREGEMCVSFILPEGMTRHFITLLDSMHSLLKVIHVKGLSQMAQQKVRMKEFNLSEGEKRKRTQDDFKTDVCALFDRYREQGEDLAAAIRLTNNDMKKKNHPWASYETIKGVLRSAGRLRKSKGHPQG